MPFTPKSTLCFVLATVMHSLFVITSIAEWGAEPHKLHLHYDEIMDTLSQKDSVVGHLWLVALFGLGLTHYVRGILLWIISSTILCGTMIFGSLYMDFENIVAGGFLGDVLHALAGTLLLGLSLGLLFTVIGLLLALFVRGLQYILQQWWAQRPIF